MCVCARSGSGVFISEVVRGGAAELDGRLMQGDQILSVNSEDTSHASQEAVAATLKVTHTSPSFPVLLGFTGPDQTHTHRHTLLTGWTCALQCARGPVLLELGRLKAASWVSSAGSQVSFFSSRVLAPPSWLTPPSSDHRL